MAGSVYSEVQDVMNRAEAIAMLTAAGEPYELESVVQYGEPCRAFRHAPRSLRVLYEATRSAQVIVARSSFDSVAVMSSCRMKLSYPAASSSLSTRFFWQW